MTCGRRSGRYRSGRKSLNAQCAERRVAEHKRNEGNHDETFSRPFLCDECLVEVSGRTVESRKLVFTERHGVHQLSPLVGCSH